MAEVVPKRPEEWTPEDKQRIAHEIAGLLDDSASIIHSIPRPVLNPLDLISKTYIEACSAMAIKPKAYQGDETKRPSPDELFDLADRPGRGDPRTRMRIARLMAGLSRPNVVHFLGCTRQEVKAWEEQTRTIPESRYAKLAPAVRVSEEYLRDGRRPIPEWLEPWAMAVNGLAGTARWMATAGMPIPGILPGPPGPGNGMVNAIDREGRGRRVSEQQARQRSSPIDLASQFLHRLEAYLTVLRHEAREEWISRHSDVVTYLPLLPYVWQRLGLLVYENGPQKARTSQKRPQI